MLSALFVYLMFITCTVLLGSIHQAKKSPAHKHLDFLRDVGDPYAEVYANKIFGPPVYVPVNPKYW